MLRSISRLVQAQRCYLGRQATCLFASHRLVHNKVGPSTAVSATIPRTSATVQPLESASENAMCITDDDYNEAMQNLKSIGVDPVLNSALQKWSKLESHGKPYIRPEILNEWKKSVVFEFVNRLCDAKFVERTKTSESLSIEIDKILVTSALALSTSEDECVTILCPGAPHIGVQHEADGIKYTLQHRAFCKNKEGNYCLKLIWKGHDEKRTLYESNAELDSNNVMWAGTLDELFNMADFGDFESDQNSAV